jgi:uncharacterized protein
MVGSHGHFVWYELMTTDVEAAKAFYTNVIGWETRDASMPGMPYTVFTAGDASVSGLMPLPDAASAMGTRPRWIGYVNVDDVDAAVAQIRRLGGTVHVPPTDISEGGRFSVVADPQMATLALVNWRSPGARPAASPPVGQSGHVGWHELLASDGETAFAFYDAVFEWERAEADVGPSGSYQPFAIDGKAIGGMFTKPPAVPAPFWLYYFNTGDIDAAAARVKAAGGEILEGPLEVRGVRVARCVDLQGVMFALMGERRTVGYFERTGEQEISDARGRRWSW